MKEAFDQFKDEATSESHADLYEKLAESRDQIKIRFQEEFPTLDPELFLKSQRWLELSGTTFSEELSEEVPTEVELWVTKQLVFLIESI